MGACCHKSDKYVNNKKDLILAHPPPFTTSKDCPQAEISKALTPNSDETNFADEINKNLNCLENKQQEELHNIETEVPNDNGYDNYPEKCDFSDQDKSSFSDQFERSIFSLNSHSFLSVYTVNSTNRVLCFDKINTLKHLKEQRTTKAPTNNKHNCISNNDDLVFQKMYGLDSDESADLAALMVNFIEAENIRGAKFLLAKGFKLEDVIDNEGYTCLQMAAKIGSKKMIEVFYENGANINKQDEGEKWTALILSSINGHVDCVEYLVKKKANVFLKSEDGMTALDYSKKEYKNAENHTTKNNFRKIIGILRAKMK